MRKDDPGLGRGEHASMADTFEEAATPHQPDAPLRLTTPAGELQILACTDRILRLRLGSGEWVPRTSYLADQDAWSYPATQSTPGGLQTNALSLAVSHDPPRLTFAGGSGQPFLTLSLESGLTIEAVQPLTQGENQRT